MAQNRQSQPGMSALSNPVSGAVDLALEDMPVIGAVIEVAKVIDNPDLLNDPNEAMRLGTKIAMAAAV